MKVDVISDAVIADEVTITNNPNHITGDASWNLSYETNPEGATGKVTWSVDDNTLATIDQYGNIITNANGKTGNVIVTLVLTNENGTVATDSVIIEIGNIISVSNQC
ncbi:Ig-like domain-containing protein [Mammaliicoccus sciuri]|uniref:Ig-like domain-containing protein n=1 Tax=Mammaliicoccus sciuri TaxID=1296 RepID=UPI0034DCC567